MSELEEKLEAVLNDPNMMQQLMTMAQSLSAQSAGPPPEAQTVNAPPAPMPPPATTPPLPAPLPQIDPAMLQRLAGLSTQGRVDKNQQALLSALGPYLSKERISKLERAMRAAKMAQFASTLLGQGGISSIGR